MSIINEASDGVIRRGFDYFVGKKVTQVERSGGHLAEATVLGSDGKSYAVLVDAETPSASRCTCAYFESRSKICKHIVAAYLAAFKGEALEFIENRMEQWDIDDNWVKEQEQPVQDYIQSLPRDELEELLIDELFNGPRWRLKKFVDYMEYDLIPDEPYNREDMIMKYENKKIVIEPAGEYGVAARFYSGDTVADEVSGVIPDPLSPDGLASFELAALLALQELCRRGNEPKGHNEGLKVGDIVRVTGAAVLLKRGAVGIVSWVDEEKGKCGVEAPSQFESPRELAVEPLRFDEVERIDI